MADNDDFYTVTMARIYADQGHFDRAVEIYRYLLSAEPGRKDLIAALEAIEQRASVSQKKDLASLVPLMQEWIDLLLAEKNIGKLERILEQVKSGD